MLDAHRTKALQLGISIIAATLIFSSCGAIDKSGAQIAEAGTIIPETASVKAHATNTPVANTPAISSTITPTSAPLAEDDPARLLAMIPDRELSLYSLEDDGVVLSAGDRKYYYDWQHMTPRMIYPEMALGDYDDDGKEELAVILYIGSGTGVSVSELHMVEQADHFQDYVFAEKDYLAQVNHAVSFESYIQDDQLIGKVTAANGTTTVNLQDLHAPDVGKLEDAAYFGSIVHFEMVNNKLIVRFGLGLCSEKVAAPLYIGDVLADVNYQSGEFTLSSFRFEAYPEYQQMP